MRRLGDAIKKGPERNRESKGDIERVASDEWHILFTKVAEAARLAAAVAIEEHFAGVKDGRVEVHCDERLVQRGIAEEGA